MNLAAGRPFDADPGEQVAGRGGVANISAQVAIHMERFSAVVFDDAIESLPDPIEGFFFPA